MKKGSLNLSIQAIVIVVLAMTLLGLGLGFLRSQFSQIGGISTDVQTQVKEQITEQLRVSGSKVSFPRTVLIERNEQKVVTVGVQNTGSSRVYFGLELSFDELQSDNLYDEYDFRYLNNSCSYTLGPSESDAYGVSMKAPPAAGTDTMTIRVIRGATDDTGECLPESVETTIYATTSSFITVV